MVETNDAFRATVGKRDPLAAPRPLTSREAEARDPHEAVVSAVWDVGEATVDALVRLLPGHPAPLSVVLDLVDAGLVQIDVQGAFCATTLVRPAMPSWAPRP